MTIPPCPHCGKEDFVFRNIRMYGWAQEFFNLAGQVEELNLDKARSSSSKTLRCCYCGKIRRDLEIVMQNWIEVVKEKTRNV